MKRIADRRAAKKEIAKRRVLLRADAATELGDTTRAAAHFLKRLKRGHNITCKKCKVTKKALQEAQESLRNRHYRLMRVVRDTAEPFCEVYNMDEVGFCCYEGAHGKAYFLDGEEAVSFG